MESIIRQLYNGEIYPFEQILPRSEEYRELRKSFLRNHEGLCKKLKESSADLFHDWEQTDTERCYLSSMQSEECFYEGFRMGAALMIEVFFGGQGYLHR